MTTYMHVINMLKHKLKHKYIGTSRRGRNRRLTERVGSKNGLQCERAALYSIRERRQSNRSVGGKVLVAGVDDKRLIEMCWIDSVVFLVVHHDAAQSRRLSALSRIVDPEEVASLDDQRRAGHVDALDADGGRRQRDAVLQHVFVVGQLAPDADVRRTVRTAAEVDDLAQRRVARDAVVEHQAGAVVVTEARQTGRITANRSRTELIATCRTNMR